MSQFREAIRRLLRSAVLLPILPAFFKIYVDLLRTLTVLPKSKRGVSTPKRALVINLSGHLGDIVMQLPFLERLHSENPDLILHVAVGKPMGALLREIPYVGRVHEIDFGKSQRKVLGNYARIWAITRYFVQYRPEFRFDICLIPRWGMDPFGSAYLAYLTGSPTRIGSDPRTESATKEAFPGSRLLLTKAIGGGHGLPEAIRELHLLAACGFASTVDLQEAEQQPIKVLSQLADGEPGTLVDFGLSRERNFCVIAPGASASFRRWPVENFVRVAVQLGRRFEIGFVAVGSPAEIEFGTSLERLSRGAIRNLIGQTSLAQTLMILKNASLFMGNDSGPAHLAGGIGTPSIVISQWPLSAQEEGPTSPARSRPVGPCVKIIQPLEARPPCKGPCVAEVAHCILSVTAEQIFDEASLVLQRKRTTKLLQDSAGDGNFEIRFGHP